MTLKFTPYRSKRAFEEISTQIKQAILTKRIKKGDRLPSERTLAEQFQVGRMTIREALRTLELSGFIVIKRGSSGGAFVANPDSKKLPGIIIEDLLLRGVTTLQMNEARIALECDIVKLVIKHANSEDLARIKRHIYKFDLINDEISSHDFLAHRIEFHMLVAQASHNQPLTVFLSAFMEWARRILENGWYPSIKDHESAWLFHRKLFDAIERKNTDLAQRLIKNHVEHVGALIAEFKDNINFIA